MSAFAFKKARSLLRRQKTIDQNDQAFCEEPMAIKYYRKAA